MVFRKRIHRWTTFLRFTFTDAVPKLTSQYSSGVNASLLRLLLVISVELV
jgi:hypothetical protein